VKLMFGMVAVLVMLLGMILGIGHLDGLTLGEPSEEAAAPAEQEQGPAMATGEELEYLKFMMGYVSTVGNAVNEVGSLLAQPALEDQTWRAVLTSVLSGIKESPDSISGIIPPPALQGFHDASLLFVDHCSRFAVLVYDSLGEGETELSEEATAELVKADEAYVEMDRLLAEFLEEHSVEQE
jgi:hypothetical protein